MAYRGFKSIHVYIQICIHIDIHTEEVAVGPGFFDIGHLSHI